ncbi:MAG TPA: 50S ribosomal protein L25 [Tepidisphaeraceae bacterium]|nr:50S ribosomal protein L25 [Tepidisphaeraceae bacterium]
MSQTASIDVKARPELGSRRNKRLRDAGFVPGVIYGHKEAVIPVTLPKKELVGYLNKGTHVFALALDGKSETVLVKDVQYDHLGLEVLHVDFARVDLNETVQVTVPLVLKGTPKGEAENGVLQQNLADLEIECTVTNIPNEIRVSVADLGLNDVIHIKDLKLPDGVKALQDEDLIVCSVKEVVEEDAAAAEGVAEPEVIGATDDAAEGEKKE